MSDILDAALAYAELGWSVFPIEPATKNPYKGTRGFRDASTDEAQLRAWWGPDGEPGAWIGLALRPSGLIAFDVDPRNGGTETLARLEAKFGPLPRTLVQESNSGGLHILTLDPGPGVDGWSRTAKEGGEIRGKLDAAGCGLGVDLKCNGYVLLEPSGRYRWLVFGDAPPVPDAWLGAIRKPAAELSGAAPDGEGLEAWEAPSDHAPLPAADRERLRADLRALGPRAKGGGTTFAAVLRVFHDYGLSLEDGYPLILEWNASCGSPRSEAELHRQIHNIAEGGRASGRRGAKRSDLSRVQAIVRAAYDHRAVTVPEVVVAAPAPPTEDAAPDPEPPAASARWLPPACAPEPETPNADPVYAEQLEKAAQEVLDRLSVEAQPVASLVPMFETARSLRARAFPPVPWLITRLLPRLGTHGVSGEPKTSKSWLSLELCLAIATATPAFGKFTVEHPGRAAYFFAEDVGPSVQTRINALTAGRHGMVAGWEDRLIVQPRGRSIDLMRDIDLVQIVASVRMHGPVDLLVLDPLRDIHSGEEDGSDTMKPVMERLRVIGDILGCAVMFVHHSAKASADSGKRRGGQRMRGSGAIHGSLDCGLYLYDLRGNGETEFVNAVESEVKLARSAGTFDLKLEIVDNKHGTAERATWTVSDRAKEDPKASGKAEATLGDVLMCLFAFAGAAMTAKSIHGKVKGSLGVVMALCAAATREGLVAESKAGTISLGFALTDKGRKACTAGSAGLAQPTTPAPHPATVAFANVPPEEP